MEDLLILHAGDIRGYCARSGAGFTAGLAAIQLSIASSQEKIDWLYENTAVEDGGPGRRDRPGPRRGLPLKEPGRFPSDPSAQSAPRPAPAPAPDGWTGTPPRPASRPAAGQRPRRPANAAIFSALLLVTFCLLAVVYYRPAQRHGQQQDKGPAAQHRQPVNRQGGGHFFPEVTEG